LRTGKANSTRFVENSTGTYEKNANLQVQRMEYRSRTMSFDP